MLPLPARSPFDGGKIVVTRFFCPDTQLTVEGQFEVVMPFAQLSAEQIQFVELFVRCEGKLNRMEGELNISYPTIRSRLLDIIRALGYEPGKDEPAASPIDRQQILAELDAGRMSFDEAMTMLKGGER